MGVMLSRRMRESARWSSACPLEEILAAVQNDVADLKIFSKRGIQISRRGNATPIFQTLRYMEYLLLDGYQNGRQSKFQ